MYNRYFKSIISIFAVCLVLAILFGIFGPYMMDSSVPTSAQINGAYENPKVVKMRKAISAGEFQVCAKSYHSPVIKPERIDGDTCCNAMLIFLLKNKMATGSTGSINLGHLVLLCDPGLTPSSLLTDNLDKMIYTVPIRWRESISAGWYLFPGEAPIFFIYQTDAGLSSTNEVYALNIISPCKPVEGLGRCLIEKQLIGMSAFDALAGDFKDKANADIFISSQASNSRNYHDPEYGKYRPITYVDGHFVVGANVTRRYAKSHAKPLPVLFRSTPQPTSQLVE